MNTQYLSILLLAVALNATANDAKNDWHDTTLSEETIQKIQQAGFDYKKCASDAMQKEVYLTQDSRAATEEVIKSCEPILAKMRQVYVDENVPEVVADRHLKQMRIKTTRNVLQEMMYTEAARSVAPKQ